MLSFQFPEGWSQWSPFDPCRGDCTHSPYTRTRYRTCRTNVTSFGVDACPPTTFPTETRRCDHLWSQNGDCSYGNNETHIILKIKRFLKKKNRICPNFPNQLLPFEDDITDNFFAVCSKIHTHPWFAIHPCV